MTTALDPPRPATPGSRIARLLRRLPDRSGLLLAAYWLAEFTATHVPRPKRPPGPLPLDKLYHAVAYAGLAALFAYWLTVRFRLRPSAVAFMTVAALAAYGAFDELTQPIAGRSTELRDWLADLVGIGIGLAAVRAIGGRLPSRGGG